ncbi:ATP-binding protein [Candidatus Bipolaricaulota bacterium]|nr:ATP-binding protein [Candidatus Bipolaricaulota bacterium]
MRLMNEACSVAGSSWAEINRSYMMAQLQRLRLLLERRALWLRHQWEDDPPQPYRDLAITDAEAERLFAGEDRAAELRFYEEDPQARSVSRGLLQLEQERLEAAPERANAPALEVVSHLLGLTPFEQDVLLLCAAPCLDPGFERILAYVQDDARRTYATPHLAMLLFADSEEIGYTAWESFLPGAPLRRFRLVTMLTGLSPGAASVACPMHLDAKTADYLRGIDRLDTLVVPLLQPIPSVPCSDEQDELARRLAASLCSIEDAPWPMVNLVGPAGAGHRALAKSLCDRLGVSLFRLTRDHLPPRGPELADLVGRLERDASLSHIAYYVDAFDLPDSPGERTADVKSIVDELRTFLLIGGENTWESDRETLTVRIRKPEAAVRVALWTRALGESSQSVDCDVEALAEQFGFGPETIARAAVAARQIARFRAPSDDGHPTRDDLWRACREQSAGRLKELAQRIDPCYTWDDIVVPTDVRAQLREIASQVACRPQVYARWGFGAKLSRGRGVSALFSGSSGTGKTMAAEILANHIGGELYRIDLASVVSKYIGETEKNLRRVFDVAEQSGAILFFDEADALFGKRTEVKDSHDRYANIEINYLLQRMEEYSGLAILATNRRSALDQAFMRRLRFLVNFPFPDASSRQRIWQSVFPPNAAKGRLDYKGLAQLEISGGSIRNISLNAAFLAAGESAPISMSHVVHAARREYAKIDKAVNEAEFGSLKDD